MATTQGQLLGGRVVYRQPVSGFRTGIEPILLAASIPARTGEHVLEAGTGAGAALLCLTARVPGVYATGVEIDAAMADLAAANAGTNGFSGIGIVPGSIETEALPRLFDHAMANPPYHRPSDPASPDAARATAKRGSHALIRSWIERLSMSLRPRGSLTLIVSVGMVPACLTAMSGSRCPCTAIFPLWPKVERSAKLVLLRGVKDSRAPMRLLAGMVLHRADGSFSAAAQAIIGDAAALAIDG
jgi:tRNA1Val (adenine37-N6)-methyltransferase